MSEQSDSHGADEQPGEQPDAEPDDVREDMVQKLLKGFHEHDGPAAFGAFMGAEFQHDPPTDAERAEAHRRYVDELAERGITELGDGER
jgi:hypothetical protein